MPDDISVIATRRLRIAPFGAAHLTERYVAWLNDKALMKYSEQRHRAHTLESCRRYWQSFAGSPNFFWAIEEVEEGLGHIGNVNAYCDRRNLVADIGLLIGEPAAAGRHYGLEAWLGVADFLFRRQGMRKVTGGCIAENAAMVRIMEKAGMVPDGVRARQYLVDGREVDLVHRAFFRSAWETWRQDAGHPARQYLVREPS